MNLRGGCRRAAAPQMFLIGSVFREKRRGEKGDRTAYPGHHAEIDRHGRETSLEDFLFRGVLRAGTERARSKTAPTMNIASGLRFLPFSDIFRKASTPRRLI